MCVHSSRQKLVLVAILLVLTFFLPQPALAAETYQNPSREEIALKLEQAGLRYGIPAEILKAIAYHESGWQQFNSKGQPISSGGSKPALGIMQVTGYSFGDTAHLQALKYDIDYNIDFGARTLLGKWDATPRIGDGDKSKLENWYFAIWAYSSWGSVDNPANSAARGKVAFQDRIIKLMATPFYGDLTPTVTMTPLDPSLFSYGVLPTRDTTWETPEPFHYTTNVRKVLEPVLPGRIYGIDSSDTAAKTALLGWSTGSDVVIIAAAEDPAASLALVALSKAENAPILLTSGDELDRNSESALLFLQPQKIILSGQLQDPVTEKLRTLLPSAEVVDLRGEDVFTTSARLALTRPQAKKIVLATVDAPVDALNLAVLAAIQGYPFLLTEADSLPSATLAALAGLHPLELITSGGEAWQKSDTLAAALEASGLNQEFVVCLSGRDRYATSALLMRTTLPTVGKVFIASGANLTDALAGATLAVQQSAPLLYIPATEVPADLESYLRSLPADAELEILGDTAAIPEQLYADLIELIGSKQ
jgi:hypothetical protein